MQTFVFLTCGHVDDGKSTLVGRLLHDLGALPQDQVEGATVDGILDYSRLTDGLEDERNQGITIDVASRFFRHEGRAYRIADTPGHLQYVRNMAVAAAGADCALLVIDAAHGVREQTLRHARIARFFSIPHFIVAVNKMDLVGYAQAPFREIEAACRSITPDPGATTREATAPQATPPPETTTTTPQTTALRGGAAPRPPDPETTLSVIPVSALFGDNVALRSPRMDWYHGPALLERLAGLDPAPEREAGARLPIQSVIRIADGRGVQGRLAGGAIRVGERLGVAGTGLFVTVRALFHSGRNAERVLPGQAITLVPEEDIDLGRGTVLFQPGASPSYTDGFDAEMIWLDARSAERPLIPCILKVHHREVQAEIEVRRAGDPVSEALVFTAAPVAVDPYDTHPGTGLFLVIDPELDTVLGVGKVTAAGERAPSYSI